MNCSPANLGMARMAQLGWTMSTLGAAIAAAEGRTDPFTRITARARLDSPSRSVGLALGYNDEQPLLSASRALLNTPRIAWRPPGSSDGLPPSSTWPGRVDPPRDTTRLRVDIRLEVLGQSRQALIGPAAANESTLRYRLSKLEAGWPGHGRRRFLSALAEALGVDQRALIPGPDWSLLILA